MKILILCTGNSCRSQMAHGLLQSFDNHLIVHSAGTHPTGKVNEKAIEVMAEIGIDISVYKSKNVSQYMNDNWDYVITVCGGAREECPMFNGNVKRHLHIGFEDPSATRGNQDFINQEFRRVRDEIKKKFFELYIQEIKGQQIPKCNCGGNC